MALFPGTDKAALPAPLGVTAASAQVGYGNSAGGTAPIATFIIRLIQTKSRFNRDLLLPTLWSAIAILVIGFFISNVYREHAERNLKDLLRAELYHVIDSVTIGDKGVLLGSPQLGDLRFVQPKTGWYWMVEPQGGYTATPRVSSSLGASDLPVVPELQAPFDQNYERFYHVTDASGNRVLVAETKVVLDPDGRSARFRVAGNSVVVEEDVRDFSYSLYLALVGFGVGSLLLYALARQSRRQAR